MNLQEMSTKNLLALHNRVADKPAGPKTFATRGKLIARIESIAAAGNIHLASFGQPETVEVVEQRAEQQADAAEATDATKKKRGIGVGELARWKHGVRTCIDTSRSTGSHQAQLGSGFS